MEIGMRKVTSSTSQRLRPSNAMWKRMGGEAIQERFTSNSQSSAPAGN